jgi:phosphomevalonate kinase
MNNARVQIPGKVMLSGEYAVLHGGKAVLMPVDRTLGVTAVAEKTDMAPAAFEALRQPIPELEPMESARPLAGVSVDRAEFVESVGEGKTIKLGLGSSAAEAVGVITLRFARAGLDWKKHRRRIAELADDAHRRAQGGKGSGADVWTSALAEPITFHITQSGVEAESIDPDETLDLPSLTLVWTGVSADTREYVSAFENWLSGDALADGMLARLIDASEELASKWLRCELTELLDPVDEFNTRMRECAKAAGMNWEIDEHVELDEWARGYGGRAKPTGAGGGDLALLIGPVPYSELGNRTVLPLWPMPPGMRR